jgi:tryptophanyl-tRNA synthetase
MKTSVVSGMRSTGNLHLGNYFGAASNFVKMQHDFNCYFFVADLHSLTTHPHPEHLNKNVRSIIAEYLACGINPEICTLYIQSHVRAISELYLIMNMLAYLGELERCTTFKEKARKQPDNINAGLLTYPVLMATDIIIHKAKFVPVGKDQEQHLEMARDFVQRFNNLYGIDFFPEPQAFNYTEKLVKVPGLDGSGKMGKSEGEGNAIYLIDDEKTISKKIMRAVTDAGPQTPNSEKPEAVANLFTIMQLVSDIETYNFFDESYANCSIRYGDMKKQLAKDINTFVSPIREKIAYYNSNDNIIDKIIANGAEKANISAEKNIAEVKAIIGLKY